jgi:hypothetical protein
MACFRVSIRMLFRGYQPIMSGWQMQFFNRSGIRFRELETFLLLSESLQQRANRVHSTPLYSGMWPDPVRAA